MNTSANAAARAAPPLARKLRLSHYFTLGFGTMVGVGWLVVMDDWLRRGGPLGAVLGFAIGGALLVPIGLIYGRLVLLLPDASGEVAYAEQVFPKSLSFVTGWMMVLAYAIVCPWEAVAIGKIAAYLFPRLNSYELYQIAGQSVYLLRIIIGLTLVAVIGWMNYRGIGLSARFQNWATFGVLTIFGLLALACVFRGSASNFHPLFSHASFVSVVLVIQIVPYYMTGFESVAKCSEEAHPEFRGESYLSAILLAIGIAALFYVVTIACDAYVAPWTSLRTKSFATAVAFERAFGSRWVIRVLLAAALASLLKVYNGNFVAASRLLFALGRRGMIPARFAFVHAQNQTPAAAIFILTLASAATMFLGDSLLIPISEVGSFAVAFGWTIACAAFLFMKRVSGGQITAVAGCLVGTALMLMKLLPSSPGHFSGREYASLAAWLLLGWLLHWSARRAQSPSSNDRV